eukprot:UN06158
MLENVFDAWEFIQNEAHRWDYNDEQFVLFGTDAGAHLAGLLLYQLSDDSSDKIHGFINGYGLVEPKSYYDSNTDHLDEVFEKLVPTRNFTP